MEETEENKYRNAGKTLLLSCTHHFFFYINLFYLFILAAFVLCCGARASHCSGFFCYGARAVGAWASVVVARGL